MSYKLLAGGGVQRLADGARIPEDDRNLDCREYLAWIAGGGIAEAAEPPPAVRRIVQLSVVISRLLVRGEVAQVVAALDQIPEAKARFESLQEGIYADDEDARAIFIAANVDPDIILA